ncbi:2-aminoethylphosphonate ABC transporter permease subunit, partial [Streptomyces sp. SID11233]|nr:2-aminoethylphosphonate ABC transporter permease subunit [Streptomyces sp. SID11233]
MSGTATGTPVDQSAALPARVRPVPRWVWLLPPLAALGFAFLYPLVLLVRQSVRPDEGGTSFAAYSDVFASGAFREALG